MFKISITDAIPTPSKDEESKTGSCSIPDKNGVAITNQEECENTTFSGSDDQGNSIVVTGVWTED